MDEFRFGDWMIIGCAAVAGWKLLVAAVSSTLSGVPTQSPRQGREQPNAAKAANGDRDGE